MGTLPPRLGELDALEKLDLHGLEGLTGTVPDVLGGLRRLRRLVLRWAGELPLWVWGRSTPCDAAQWGVYLEGAMCPMRAWRRPSCWRCAALGTHLARLCHVACMLPALPEPSAPIWSQSSLCLPPRSYNELEGPLPSLPPSVRNVQLEINAFSGDQAANRPCSCRCAAVAPHGMWHAPDVPSSPVALDGPPGLTGLLQRCPSCPQAASPPAGARRAACRTFESSGSGATPTSMAASQSPGPDPGAPLCSVVRSCEWL